MGTDEGGPPGRIWMHSFQMKFYTRDFCSNALIIVIFLFSRDMNLRVWAENTTELFLFLFLSVRQHKGDNYNTRRTRFHDTHTHTHTPSPGKCTDLHPE